MGVGSGGGGVGLGVRVDVNEELNFFVRIQKKMGGGVRSGGSGWGGQGRCEQRSSEDFVRIQKKKCFFFFWGGGPGWM